jgi:hypothetical protein
MTWLDEMFRKPPGQLALLFRESDYATGLR